MHICACPGRDRTKEKSKNVYHIKESHEPVNTFQFVFFFYLNRESLHRERMQEESGNI